MAFGGCCAFFSNSLFLKAARRTSAPRRGGLWPSAGFVRSGGNWREQQPGTTPAAANPNVSRLLFGGLQWAAPKLVYSRPPALFI